jgi:hypothetical protein
MDIKSAIFCARCSNLADGIDKEGTAFCKWHAPAGGIELNIAELRERLAKAEALLKRVVDKEQAKQEIRGVIFATPNSLLSDILDFLKDKAQ